MPLGRTRQLSIHPGMAPEMLRLISEQRSINKDFDRRKPVTSPTVFNNDAQRPPATKNPRRIIFVRQADGSFRGQYSDGSNWQTFLATAVSFATPTVTFGTAYAAGTAATTMRSDATLKYPAALMSAANSSTLTLTDNATDQTLTGSLGTLNLDAASHIINLEYFTGAGGTAGVNTALLSFSTGASTVGSQMNYAINGLIKWDDGTAYSSATHTGILLTVQDLFSGGATYTGQTDNGIDLNVSYGNPTAGTHTWTEINGIRVNMVPPKKNTSSGVTVTDARGIRLIGWPGSLFTAGTYTNAYAADLLMPNIGNTVRRGVYLRVAGTGVGTAPTNEEGFYCDQLKAGTGQRTGYYAVGATTGTPTTCVGFYAAAHGVGTNKWSFFANDPSTFAGITMTDATDITLGTGTGTKLGTGTTQKLGFWNAAPAGQPATTGTITGFTAGGGAAVDDKGTFTGNTGATAYTISDIVNNLKTCGILKT